ncbi:MAG: DUF4307 domain-containing protein [Mycobacteriales bacterium]|nr:DUF4307 domain-containing protein [Frankia sp.]
MAAAPESPDRATRAVRAATVAIGVLLVGLALFVVTRQRSVPAIDARVTNLVAVDDSHALVTIEVDKAPLASARCQVTAFGATERVVGRLIDIPVGPNAHNGRRMTKTVELATEARAVTAHIAQCEITRTR